MKADVRPPIYQTMVSAVPSYQFEAMGVRYEGLMDDGAEREHPLLCYGGHDEQHTNDGWTRLT